MNSAEQFRDRLKIEADPFSTGTSGPHLGRPLQSAFREIVRHIAVKTPIVLVTGDSGTGKTLLVDMTARLCSEMGLSVRRVDRGDLVHITFGQHSDVLLIDEANSLPESMLDASSAEAAKNQATTTVFLGLPSCTGRFILSNIRPVLIELTSLAPADARSYLTDRATGAGLRDLFTDEALELIIVGTHGSPRALRSIASLAFFFAASAGASQIRVEHVTSALIGRVPSGGQKVEDVIRAMPPIDAVPAEEKRPAEIPFPLAGRKPGESVHTALHFDDTPAGGRAPAEAPFPFAAQKPGETGSPQSRIEKAEDQRQPEALIAAQVPLELQRLPDNMWLRRPDAEPAVEEFKTSQEFPGETDDTDDTQDDWRTTGEDYARPSLFSRRTLGAAITLILLVVAVVATVTPSMRAGTNPAFIPPASTAAPAVQMPSVAAPAPALPTDLANDAAKYLEPAPPLNEPVAPEPARQAAGSIEAPQNVASEPEPPRPAPRRTLSADEEAAVARGIEELQRSARRVESGRR